MGVKKSNKSREVVKPAEKVEFPPAPQPFPAVRAPIGRPSSYSEALIAGILADMSRGVSLRQICKAEGYPDESTVRMWAINDVEGFRERYDEARDAMTDAWADEILGISDDGTNDWQERETAAGRIERVVDQENIQRSRLRVDTRKWLMSKIAPRKYAERIEHAGPDGAPLIPDVASPRELAKAIFAVLAEATRPQIAGDVADAVTVPEGEGEGEGEKRAATRGKAE